MLLTLTIIDCRAAGVCNQDSRGVTHLLYYPDASDNTGDLTVYSYTAEDRWAAVRVDTPNVPTSAGGINEESFTRVFAALAEQNIPASLSVGDILFSFTNTHIRDNSKNRLCI